MALTPHPPAGKRDPRQLLPVQPCQRGPGGGRLRQLAAARNRHQRLETGRHGRQRVRPGRPGRAHPRPLEVLFHSPLTCQHRPGFADVTYYTAPSGAVSGTDRQGHQTRRLPLRARPHRRNRGLHGGPQRQAQTLRLDCRRRRRHPRQSSPRSRRPQPSSQSMMRHCTSCRRSRLNPTTVPCRGSGCWCWALYGSDRVLLC